MRWWLLWVFLIACTRTCCRLHKTSQIVSDVIPIWKKIMNGNRVLCVNMASKQAKIEFLSHISSIHSTPRCRCLAQTYTLKPRCHTSETGGLVLVVRLWILGRRATMYSKCYTCMLLCKMYNTCKTPAPWKSSQVWVNSALTRRTTWLACFSNLQKYF